MPLFIRESKTVTTPGLSDLAWKLGVKYGETHRLADVEARCTPGTSDAMDCDSRAVGCPYSHFDIFKYGAQSVWRERGEL